MESGIFLYKEHTKSFFFTVQEESKGNKKSFLTFSDFFHYSIPNPQR